MPDVTREKGLELLTQAVEKFPADELLEVYNEVFPNDPASEEEAQDAPRALVERLVEHINSRLAVADMVEFWGLIFPRHRDIEYDDEEDRIHYNEGAEAVPIE
jgi:hypothetical protein